VQVLESKAKSTLTYFKNVKLIIHTNEIKCGISIPAYSMYLLNPVSLFHDFFPHMSFPISSNDYSSFKLTFFLTIPTRERTSSTCLSVSDLFHLT
jgi:hypothetical protein